MDQSLEAHHDEPGATLTFPIRVILGGAVSVVAAVSYALLARIIAIGIEGAMITIGAAVFVPMAMGALGAELGTGVIRRSMPLRATVGFIAAAIYLAILLYIGLNGPLYTLALIPPVLASATAGGALSGLLLSRLQRHHARLVALALITITPVGIMAAEGTFPPMQSVGTLTIQQEIAADNHTVWTALLNIDTVEYGETETLFQRFGLPRLLSARMIGEGRDAVRLVTFERGIDYEEVVTGWRPPDSLRFVVEMDPTWIPENAVDPNVQLGADQFDLGEGYYALDSIGPHRTLLTISQQYRLSSALAPYLSLWTEAAISDAQRTAMGIVRRRAEREITAAK